MKKLLCFFIYFVILPLPIWTDSYKIIRIKPGQQILIGKTPLGIGDIFSDKDTIHWDSKLQVQAIEAFNLQKPERIILSKNKFRKKNKRDINYIDYKGMVSKGNDHLYSIWEGDSLLLPIENDSNYQYRLHINGFQKIYDLKIDNNNVILSWSFFEGIDSVVHCYIDRKNRFDNMIIEKKVSFDVELIK